MKQYYEEYWHRPDTYVEADPLAVLRANALWDAVAARKGSVGEFLDVGCGKGDLVAQAAERGYTARGIDISEAATQLAAKLHPTASFIAHPVEERPWPVEQSSMDIVASFEVIEHLVRPAELIRGSADVLRPGGYLAITTPYHGLLKNIALAILAFDKHFDVEGDHIRFFSDAALKSLLEEHGFVVHGFKHFGRFKGVWADTFVWAQKV